MSDGWPRAETDCACPIGDACPCEADGKGGLCFCCREGDHNGSCWFSARLMHPPRRIEIVPLEPKSRGLRTT